MYVQKTKASINDIKLFLSGYVFLVDFKSKLFLVKIFKNFANGNFNFKNLNSTVFSNIFFSSIVR